MIDKESAKKINLFWINLLEKFRVPGSNKSKHFFESGFFKEEMMQFLMLRGYFLNFEAPKILKLCSFKELRITTRRLPTINPN